MTFTVPSASTRVNPVGSGKDGPKCQAGVPLWAGSLWIARRLAWLKAALVIRPSANAVNVKYCFFMAPPQGFLIGRTMRVPCQRRQLAMRHSCLGAAQLNFGPHLSTTRASPQVDIFPRQRLRLAREES